MGLADFMTRVDHFDGLAALVIERYDRVGGDRLHQEDFSQALGARGNEKYQSIGGVVSLSRIAGVLRRHATNADLARLARMVVFAAGIGNLDMHAKNLGLLHPLGRSPELAPAYDVVPQAHVANDGELALAVNRRYRLADLTKDDITAEISSWGLRRAAGTVDSALEELSSIARDEVPLDGAFSGLRDDVLGFVGNLANGRRIGESVSRRRP